MNLDAPDRPSCPVGSRSIDRNVESSATRAGRRNARGEHLRVGACLETISPPRSAVLGRELSVRCNLKTVRESEACRESASEDRRDGECKRIIVHRRSHVDSMMLARCLTRLIRKIGPTILVYLVHLCDLVTLTENRLTYRLDQREHVFRNTIRGRFVARLAYQPCSPNPQLLF